jgi:hypothetical protein
MRRVCIYKFFYNFRMNPNMGGPMQVGGMSMGGNNMSGGGVVMTNVMAPGGGAGGGTGGGMMVPNQMAVGGGGMIVPNQMGVGGAIASGGGNMQQQRAGPAREREFIWSGELEWQEKVKDGPADQKISHSVNCTVSTSKVSQ